VDARLAQVPAVRALAKASGPELAGLYVGGSLASGDYRPGVSDIDAVALLERAPDRARRAAITARHQCLLREVPGAAALHCVYVPRMQAQDPLVKHWTWAFEELFRRPLSGIARAELLADPVVVSGPAPTTWLPGMSPDDLRTAARAELSGYWRKAVRDGAIWEQDVYIDHGVTTVARADLTIREGRLVTKSAALTHLPALGLPTDIVDDVVRRRAGEAVPMTAEQRSARATVVRRFVAAHVERLGCPSGVAG
jgi:hypothetical protein